MTTPARSSSLNLRDQGFTHRGGAWTNKQLDVTVAEINPGRFRVTHGTDTHELTSPTGVRCWVDLLLSRAADAQVAKAAAE